MGPLQHRAGRRRRGLTPTIDISTTLPRPANEVWAAVTTPDGVNAELGPWVRMTFPPEALVGLAGAPVSEPLFTSWLLFLCFIPFDRHVFELDEVGERRFVELSHSMLQKIWRHERTIEPAGEGACIVRDIVTVSPRLALVRPLARPITRMLFRHRHNRLRLLYS